MFHPGKKKQEEYKKLRGKNAARSSKSGKPLANVLPSARETRVQRKEKVLVATVKEEAQGSILDVHSRALEGHLCHLHNTPWSLLAFPSLPKPGSASLPRAEQEQQWQQ